MDNKRKTPYNFEYAVEDSKSGLDYGHKESSDGEVVTGTYYVLLPDGRKEIVNYKADVNGYVAEVTYEGEPKNDNAGQSQQTASSLAGSGISAQLQAYSNSSASVSTLTTSTRPPQTSSSIVSVATKGPSLPLLLVPTEPPKLVAEKASVVSSPSTVASTTVPTTTPSSLDSSTPNLTRSSNLSPTVPTTASITPTTTPSPLIRSSTLSPTTTTAPTIPVSTDTTSSSIPGYITTPAATLSSSSTSSSLPKSTLNSSVAQIQVNVSASISASSAKPNQNTLIVSFPQISQATQTENPSVSASSLTTRSPESSPILSIASQAPRATSFENQSFFQALARFVRSAGPIFIYCSNLLSSCSDPTRSPQVSSCSDCYSLQKICSKLDSTGQTSPINNDTLQAFQGLIPATPVWPPIKSPAIELVQKTGLSNSSAEKTLNSTITVPTTTTSIPFTRVPQSSSPPKNVSFEVPEGLADIIQSSDTHFSYCQNIRSFCPRLESTRPYWEGSSEIPSKQKEFFLSTIQACSFCRSLWPICSELESSDFLLDPSQLFTLHALEEDVRNAVFTINYCRNVTQDCNELLKSKESASITLSTVSPIPSTSPQGSNRTSPVNLSSTPSSPVLVDKPTSGSAVPSQLPEPDAQSEGTLGETKFINFCDRVTPVCSQLLSILNKRTQ